MQKYDPKKWILAMPAAIFLIVAVAIAAFHHSSEPDIPDGFTDSEEYAEELENRHRQTIEHLNQDAAMARAVGPLDSYPEDERFAAHEALVRIRLRMTSTRIACGTLVEQYIRLPSSVRDRSIDYDSCRIDFPEELEYDSENG